jgi:hypothetical protein
MLEGGFETCCIADSQSVQCRPRDALAAIGMEMVPVA